MIYFIVVGSLWGFKTSSKTMPLRDWGVKLSIKNCTEHFTVQWPGLLFSINLLLPFLYILEQFAYELCFAIGQITLFRRVVRQIV